ncbi:MAG TPA: hybrid sensor histidine kinase/response regulator [Aggregatilineaceae bacterium]|nr:hybrid sensor histidine kinase/response regulator [Aggregatilineaceae bacterium]
MITHPPDLLTGFLTEAHSYLAEMQEALRIGTLDPPRLQVIHQQATILSGATEMLGLEEVANLAAGVLTILALPLKNGHGLAAAECQKLVAALAQIEQELNRQADTQSEQAETSLPDVPAELLEIFVLEAKEHNQAIQVGLEQIQQHPTDLHSLGELRRVTHTLKGAAASIGFVHIARLAHLMEELFERCLEQNQPLEREALDLLLDSVDVLENQLQPGGALPTSLNALEGRYAELLKDNYPQPQSRAVSLPIPGLQTPTTEDMLRLSLITMDRLINRVGELIINRAGLERQIGSFRNLLAELNLTTKRLRQIAHDIDEQVETNLPVRAVPSTDPTFDPLELDRYSLLYQLVRELEEIAADTGDVNNQLHFLADDLDASLTYERRLTTDLQDGLLATRLVPFYELETRLRRTVNRTARTLSKNVELILTGFDTKVDKNILDGLADPLMHLLRNAVDHGIESPEIRHTRLKPAVGKVEIHVMRERGRVMVTLRDDGAGIDPKQIQQQAVRAGLLLPDVSPSHQQLLMLLFEDGFSLAETVTETSGRGVGLDIVRRAVSRLQGTVRVDSVLGQGTTFVITIPITMAITQALFIQCCRQQFAIPIEQVSAVLRLEPELLDELHREGVLHYEGRAMPAFDLADFVNNEASRDEPRYGLVIEADRESIVLVDAMGGIHEAVVKSLGPHLRHVHGVIGATIAGDGSVTLILDLVEILAGKRPVAEPVRHEVPGTTTPHVLVVDDSPSVRRVICSYLQRLGWQTTDAKDGVDALEKLVALHPDVALVDIEMPRMNGFELLERIKADPGLQSIPVVFLTSRSAAKHRERADQLHVDGYLVKPYRENELVEQLRRVTRK